MMPINHPITFVFSQPIDALNSVNVSLSATLRASSWIMGPETRIFLERAVLNQDHSSFKRVQTHIRLRLDAVLSSKAVMFDCLLDLSLIDTKLFS